MAAPYSRTDGRDPGFQWPQNRFFSRLLEFASVRAVGRSFPSLVAGGIVVFLEVTSQRGAAPHQAWGASDSPPGQSKRGHSAGFRDACPSPCGLGSAANPESSSLCRGRRRGILGPNTQFLRKPQAVTGPPPQVAGAGRPVGSGLHDCEPVPAASSPGRERDGADGQRGGTPRVRVRFVRCPERLWRQESPRRLPGAEGGSGKCGVSCWVRTAWSQTAVHSLLKQLKPLDRPRELVKMVRFTLHEV